MIPEISGTDCVNTVEQYTWEGFIGDAWIIIPFLLGIFVYKLFDGISVPLHCQPVEYEEEEHEDDDDVSCASPSCEPMKLKHSAHRKSESLALW